MSKCTAKEALDAFAWFLGYYEKATAKYSHFWEKEYFDVDKGSNNYTYPGYICGVNGQPWCAATVSEAIWDACGQSKEDAKAVMHGVWPYIACNQLWDAADDQHRFWSYYQRYTLGKGDRTNYIPVPGDVIVFTDDTRQRSHTGMVYAVGNGYVYTYEGNSGNMCRKRSYNLQDKYIYGYVKPLYAESEDTHEDEPEQYDQTAYKVEVHKLSTGCAGPEVKTAQRIMYAYGFKDDSGNPLAVDGAFGQRTKQATKKLQKKLGLDQTGIWDDKTWTAALTKLE